MQRLGWPLNVTTDAGGMAMGIYKNIMSCVASRAWDRVIQQDRGALAISAEHHRSVYFQIQQ
jgi:hypothetical protein